MTAPTPQPDAERVQGGEVTAAVERAAEAMEDAAFRLVGRDLGTIYRDRIARDALAAALDVEEMADVIDGHPEMVWRESGEMECRGCEYRVPEEEVTTRHVSVHQAAMIRAALLGEA